MSDVPPGIGRVILQPTDVTEVPKRGRPRTKVQPQDTRPPSTSSAPISRQIQQNEEERRRLLKAKKEKEVDEYQKKIVTEFNDQLLEALVAMGFPAEFFYKGGVPKKQAIDPNYTDLAQGISINPLQADWIAHGLVEVKYIPAIQKLMIGSNPEGPSYFWLAMGALGTFSYVTTLVTTMKKLKEIMATLQAIKESGPEGPVSNGPTFAEPSFEGAAPIFEGS